MLINSLPQVTMPPAVIWTGGPSWPGLFGCLRSLGSRGVPVFVAGPARELELLQRSRFCRGIIDTGSYDIVSSWQVLSNWCKKSKRSQKPYLCILADSILWNIESVWEELGNHFCIGHSKCYQSLRDILDKWEMISRVEQLGIRIPRSTLLRSPANLELVEAFKLPVIVKPARPWPRCDFKAAVFSEWDRLRSFLVENKQCSTLLAQEYVPGSDDQIYCYLFLHNHGARTSYEWTGRKIIQFPTGQGIMALGETFVHEDLSRAGRMITQGIGYEGLGGIEFKAYDGQYYFIEMSPRLEGFHGLGAKAGVDLAWLSYCLETGYPAPDMSQKSRRCFYLDETALDKHTVKHLLPKSGKLLGAALTGRLHTVIFSIDDRSPFQGFAMRKVRTAFCSVASSV